MKKKKVGQVSNKLRYGKTRKEVSENYTRIVGEIL